MDRLEELRIKFWCNIYGLVVSMYLKDGNQSPSGAADIALEDFDKRFLGGDVVYDDIVYEDDLPKTLSKELYSLWLEASWLDNGMRVGPKSGKTWKISG